VNKKEGYHPVPERYSKLSSFLLSPLLHSPANLKSLICLMTTVSTKTKALDQNLT